MSIRLSWTKYLQDNKYKTHRRLTNFIEILSWYLELQGGKSTRIKESTAVLAYQCLSLFLCMHGKKNLSCFEFLELIHTVMLNIKIITHPHDLLFFLPRKCFRWFYHLDNKNTLSSGSQTTVFFLSVGKPHQSLWSASEISVWIRKTENQQTPEIQLPSVFQVSLDDVNANWYSLHWLKFLFLLFYDWWCTFLLKPDND